MSKQDTVMAYCARNVDVPVKAGKKTVIEKVKTLPGKPGKSTLLLKEEQAFIEHLLDNSISEASPSKQEEWTLYVKTHGYDTVVSDLKSMYQKKAEFLVKFGNLTTKRLNEVRNHFQLDALRKADVKQDMLVTTLWDLDNYWTYFAQEVLALDRDCNDLLKSFRVSNENTFDNGINIPLTVVKIADSLKSGMELPVELRKNLEGRKSLLAAREAIKKENEAIRQLIVDRRVAEAKDQKEKEDAMHILNTPTDEDVMTELVKKLERDSKSIWKVDLIKEAIVKKHITSPEGVSNFLSVIGSRSQAEALKMLSMKSKEDFEKEILLSLHGVRLTPLPRKPKDENTGPGRTGKGSHRNQRGSQRN